MKHIYLAALLATALPLTAAAQTTFTDADLANAYTMRTYDARVSVHDPSVVVDNITNPSSPVYYIYGSHLGRGKTTQADNYQRWTTFASDENNTGTENSLFANTAGVLINYQDAYSVNAVKKVKNYKGEEVSFGTYDAHGWQKDGNNVRGNQWAPDIIYNKTMQKWCLYMSINGESWASSIVCLTSDSPEGPWIYQGPVVFSGFFGKYAHNGYAAANDWQHTDLAIATGATSLPERYNTGGHWGTFWPNCIDPCVFYDDNDNLWMTYGSWSGGIFMLKLNAENGLRDYTHTYPYEVSGSQTTPGKADANCTSDPYFGKKIAGGYYVSGEASYIQKVGNYYFLFVTYGGLNPAMGYQMHIFRSSNPEGPYVDANGTSALYTSYKMNYGSNATDNRGILLMDGYKWDTMPTGEVAQGHNSAFIDDKGREFVVYHTKFNDGTFGHQVRVHQMYLNEDGWLVTAPYEFDGETATDQTIATQATVADADIPGTYQFIRQQYNQSHAKVANDNETTTAKMKEPVNITLTADGKVSGRESGSWHRTAGTDYITLTLSGVDYKGVLVNQTIDYTDIPAVCITAVSDDSGNNGFGAGVQTRQQEVWASKADPKAAIKYTLDKISLPFTDGSTINSDMTLPEKGFLGTTISWKTSDENIFDADFGEITGKGPVTLTMTITTGDYKYNKEFSLTVDKDAKATTPVYYPVSSQKNTDAAWWSNFSTQSYTLKKGNSAEFHFINYTNRQENYKNWSLYGTNGPVGSADYKEYFGIRNDNWDNVSASNTGCTSNFVWDTFKADMDSSRVDMTVNYAANGTFTMTSTITTKAGKVYNYSFTKAVDGAPAELTLFFVSEGSYIDGSSLETADGIFGVKSAENKVNTENAVYNLAGQRVGKNYRGVVIVNGHKEIRR